VTSILRILDKPQLNDWKTDQAIMAVLTSSRNHGESLDDFVNRVLRVEQIQEQEAKKAREKGSAIHEALANALAGKEWDKTLDAFVEPVLKCSSIMGKLVWSEKVLVGNGYAGRADALFDNQELGMLTLVDFKTAGKLPKASYDEHILQTSAYAACVNPEGRKVVTANVYIDTKNPGQFVPYSQECWQDTYENGFKPLLRVWQWINEMRDE
jgi:CRISPR/Cas system-associated exonuclease Cas4 (RecB family)